MDLKDISPRPIGLWTQEELEKALDIIFQDPLFDDIK